MVKKNNSKKLLRQHKFNIALAQKKQEYLIRKKIKSYPITENSMFRTLYKGNTLLKNRITFLLTIKVLANNVFCSFKNILLNKTIFIFSAGLLQLKMTKKKIKTTPKLILDQFFARVTTDLINPEILLINITAPLSIKEYIIESLFAENIKKHSIIINIKNKKSFNGCRPKKNRRGKRSSELKLLSK